MYNLSQQEQIDKLRREDAIRRAAAKQQATDEAPKKTSRPTLARLGAALSNAGDYLQDRYDNPKPRNYGLESA